MQKHSRKTRFGTRQTKFGTLCHPGGRSISVKTPHPEWTRWAVEKLNNVEAYETFIDQIAKLKVDKSDYANDDAALRAYAATLQYLIDKAQKMNGR